jgi:hypothetical protein
MLRANGSVCLAFDETHMFQIKCFGVVVYVWPMHGVILSASSAYSPLRPSSFSGVGLHLFVCVTHVTGIA